MKDNYDKYGIEAGNHIPGTVIHQYLEDYVRFFGCLEFIRLNWRVESVEWKSNTDGDGGDGSWLVIASPTSTATAAAGNGPVHKDTTWEIVTKKLIIATGVTSEPILPLFAGQESFGMPLFHSRDLARLGPQILQPKEQKRVTVLGGNKSGWDSVYMCASSGVQVDWVIRESGHGPIWMSPPYVTPFKLWLEGLVTRRLITWFSPCVWGDFDGFGIIRRFLHGTWLGGKIVDFFWMMLSNDLESLNDFDSHPDLAKLRPWMDPFWVASSLSIINYPTNFYDLIKNGMVRVHIADIDHLSHHAAHLSSGEVLSSSGFIACTGWRSEPRINFLPSSIESQLGLPWAPDPLDQRIVDLADAEILHRFPRLKNQPPHNPKYRAISKDAAAIAPHPYRLSRFMVPMNMVHERSIAFMGVTISLNTTMLAQTQALWITAYLSNRLDLTSREHCPPTITSLLSPSSSSSSSSSPTGSSSSISLLKPTLKTTTKNNNNNNIDPDLIWETALHTQQCIWRYPGGFGKRNPDFVFDFLPYLDMLLCDLGLSSHRKSGLWANCFQSYSAKDYKGIVHEWMRSQGLLSD